MKLSIKQRADKAQKVKIAKRFNNRTAIIMAVIFATIGLYLVYTSRAAVPVVTFEAENTTITSPAVSVNDTGASAGKALQFNAATPPPPPPPPPTGTGPVAAGSVGYLGATSALKIIDGPEDAPAGSFWNSQYGYLHLTGATITLDKVWIKGGLYSDATNLTVRNSIVEGGGSWFILTMARGGTLLVEDSTLRWRNGIQNPSVSNGSGVIQISGGTNMTVRRADLSGNPDGIQASGTTVLDKVWIHDLAQVGTYPNNTHNDGIQFYGGSLTITNSRIDTKPSRQPYSNAAIFSQGGQPGDPVRITDTYLNGGGYTLYMQTSRTCLTRVTFGPDHLWGEQIIQSPGTLGC